MLACIGVLVSSLEVLARPAWLADTSWNSWSVHRLRYAGTAGVAGRVLGAVLAFPNVLAVMVVRALAASLVLAVPLRGSIHDVALAVVAAGLAARMLRSPYGGEGSDQVLLIVVVTLVAVAVNPSPIAMRVGLWFIAAQACLAYLTSGVFKVASSVWWDGSALLGVMSTQSWGNPVLAAWLRQHPDVNQWLSRLVGLGEACFPLVLLAPPPLLPVLLAAGLGFHLVVAAVMGLNCFVWAFAATYPAIVFTATG
jgi:hypothetical protein